MSGWDASSRPSWDSQGGAGENTQAFGTPEHAEGTDDRWPEPGAMPAGSGYTPEHSRRPDGTQPSRRPARHRPEEPAADQGGFPSSASPGTPPPIFLQDYDQNDYAQGDYARGDFGLGDSAQGGFGGQDEFGQNGFGHRDFGQRDLGQRDVGQRDVGQRDLGQRDLGQPDFGQRPPAGRGYVTEEDFGQRGNGHRRAAAAPHDRSPQDYAPQDYAPQDYAPQAYAPQDYAPQDFPGQDFPGQDYAAQDFPGRDFPGQDYAAKDYASQDYASQDYTRQRAPRDDARTGYPFTDHPDPHGQADQDHDYAARMDPALRDFFAPPPARQDRPQRTDRPDRQDRAQGYGQRGASGYGGQSRSPWTQAGQAGQPGQAGQAGLDQDPRQPGGPRTAPPSRSWDAPSPRPGSRSARRQEQDEESGHRGLIIAIVAIVILAAAGAGYYLTRHHSGSNTQTPPASTPTPSASVTQSAAGSPAPPAGYTLTVPVTAGGYHALTSIPTAMQSTAGTTETAIAGTALKDGGGKVAGRGVATAYQLSGGQTMTYMGYQGTFNPDKVIANLASLGSSMQTYNPGPHGGKFACATAPGTSSGTVCMWVTTTTFAVTEFFGSTGPEVVSHQYKAAADTLNVRNSVEVPKT